MSLSFSLSPLSPSLLVFFLHHSPISHPTLMPLPLLSLLSYVRLPFLCHSLSYLSLPLSFPLLFLPLPLSSLPAPSLLYLPKTKVPAFNFLLHLQLIFAYFQAENNSPDLAANYRNCTISEIR